MRYELKYELLKWLTGNYELQEPYTDVSQAMAHDVNTDNFIKDLNTKYNSYELIDVFPIISNNSQINMSIAYGNHGNDGFVCLVDGKGNTIQIIERYSSGTKLGKFITLNIDETGKFYAIDIFNSRKRVVLLNNFVVKKDEQANYVIKIRKAYNIDSNTQAYSSDIVGCKKSPSEAIYMIYGTTGSSNPFVTKFKIDIEQGNEWVDYTYSDGYSYEAKDLYVSNWEKLYFQLGCIVVSGTTYWYKEVGILVDETTTMSLIKTSTLSTNNIAVRNLIIQNTLYTYISYMGGGAVNVDRISRTTNTSIQILNSPIGTAEVGIYLAPMIKIIGNEIFIHTLENYFGSYAITTGRIYENVNIEGTVYPAKYVETREKLYSTPQQAIDDFSNVFFVTKMYNLYTYYYLWESDNSLEFCIEVYNENNYNGYEYFNTNTFIPNSCILYEEYHAYNLPCFARNLYNKQVNGTTTISTLQIPNVNLNDVQINLSFLLSETMAEIIVDSNEYNKNIYETLYMNFIHTLTMSNRNDPNNIIYNNNGAVKLNHSISRDEDYNNSKSTKYRINYSDGSSTIFNFGDIIVNNTVATYTMVVYNGDWKTIDTIDIISDDETTIYQTITPNLETNKYYEIIQLVEIV